MAEEHPIRYKVSTKLEKYEGEWTPKQIENGEAKTALKEVVESEGNMLLIGGGSAIWDLFRGAGAVIPFNGANTYIAVGDSSTAEAETQTDLVAVTNKFRKQVDSGYPQHTDTTNNTNSKSIVYKATYGVSQANFDWNEWGIVNASTAGRMFNRKVEVLGTKTSAGTWVFTITIVVGAP